MYNPAIVLCCSYDEMAKYDLPALIDYVLNRTGSTEIYYAGHSQGTVQAFAGLSQDVELGKKIKTFFALAPVTNVTKIISPIRYLSPLAKDFQVNKFSC
jgi:predicted alpha/beta hydrolase